MNKIVQINLGGYALTMDEEAYEALGTYLRAVDRSFAHLEGRAEILQDIESRMAELFQERLKGRQIVGLADVEAVRRIMGQPEDIGDAGPEGATREQSEADPGSTFRTGRRLFRDTDHAMVGGVCSGLSAYFGIADPVWMRLIFVLMAFAGFGVITYFVLMILVPKARTAADRLAMRGEPVNIDTIAESVERQFDEISRKLNEIGDEMRGRKSKK